jgi:hypothetical protein
VRQKFKSIPEDISEYLGYCPETGKLYWKKQTSKQALRARVGAEAGCLDKASGYMNVRFRGERYQVHRVAWKIFYGTLPANVDIDHRDLNKSNNKIENLRRASRSNNCMNTAIRSNSTSGYKGVSLRADMNKWRARITVGGKRRCIGYFETREQAHDAYSRAMIEAHGEFARVA